jgi:hypothetical protein
VELITVQNRSIITHQIKTTLGKSVIRQVTMKVNPLFHRQLTTRDSSRSHEPAKQTEVTVRFLKWQVQISYNLPCPQFNGTVFKECQTDNPLSRATKFLTKIAWDQEYNNNSKATQLCIRATTTPASATTQALCRATPTNMPQLTRALEISRKATLKVVKATEISKVITPARVSHTQDKAVSARRIQTKIIK